MKLVVINSVKSGLDDQNYGLVGAIEFELEKDRTATFQHESGERSLNRATYGQGSKRGARKSTKKVQKRSGKSNRLESLSDLPGSLPDERSRNRATLAISCSKSAGGPVAPEQQAMRK